jgi:hypothetical protein
MPQGSPHGTPTWRPPAHSQQFDQVQGVTDANRTLAFANIRQAASYFGVHVTESSWRDLMGSR